MWIRSRWDSKVDRHLDALNLAKECVALGGHGRTIELVSGLNNLMLRHFFDQGEVFCRGRFAGSVDWFYSANLIERAEACVFACIFSDIHRQSGDPGHALVASYRMYRERCFQTPRISMDRAFDIAANLHGLWQCEAPRFALSHCGVCRTRYLEAINGSGGDPSGCIFCKLLHRYKSDDRLRSTFPAASLDDVDVSRWKVFGFFSADPENTPKTTD